MRYTTTTEVPPEEVLERAEQFFSRHSRLRVTDRGPDSITFAGDIGLARLRVDREHGRTNVHAQTDRVVGLDVTDLTKRFLYTLRTPETDSRPRAEVGRTDTGETGPADLPVRLIMPDRWMEHLETLPPSTRVSEAKRLGLEAMLPGRNVDPADFYTEYAEREVRDETLTLAQLGFRPNETLSIREYDLGHPPRFRG